MMEEPIEIQTPDGTADGFLYRPDDGGHLPGVIHLTDIGGIRSSQKAMASRLAAAGYTVLLPNIFYRAGRPPVINYAAGFDSDEAKQRMTELRTPLTPEAQERDAGAYVDWLAGHAAVAAGGIGAVGYCFSGGLALRAAAARPERVKAAASFHGGGLATDAPASAHLLLPRIQARLYFGHATEDRGMPPEAIDRLDQALAAWGGRYESEVYAGARHGWTVPDSPVFNGPQAERAFAKLTGLLAQALGPASPG
ncbi:MAG TPA: dienelactone hydrolase family protein [Thermoanaerobaculia bacterium]|jgi:carboxymethylenebutenolidase|nr:dienelactone hydrolase family protein [Thermoanaerobaculia bacterium]